MRIDERELYERIGQELRDHRQRMGVTQDQLAKQVGVERTSITNIERGNQKLPLHLLYRICQVLHLDVISVLPKLDEVRVSSELEMVELDGQTNPVPLRTASFIRGVFEGNEEEDESNV